MLDLDEITEDIGLGRFQLLQQLLVSGVRLADGAEILISSAVLSILQQVPRMALPEPCQSLARTGSFPQR